MPLYSYADPTTGTRVTIYDDGRIRLTDNQNGEMVIGLTTVSAEGVIGALDVVFPQVPGFTPDAPVNPETPPAAQSTSGS